MLSQPATTLRRPLGALLFIVAAVAGLALAFATATGLFVVLGVLMVLSGAGALLSHTYQQGHAHAVPVSQARHAPVPQTTVLTADGTRRSAQLVPLPQAAGQRCVLTAQGYALVDDQGRVRYTL